MLVLYTFIKMLIITWTYAVASFCRWGIFLDRLGTQTLSFHPDAKAEHGDSDSDGSMEIQMNGPIFCNCIKVSFYINHYNSAKTEMNFTKQKLELKIC